MVHAALLFILLWALAYMTLAAALVMLNIYYSLIGNDLVLRSVRQEALIAGIASLIEGASAWTVISFLPAAARAMFLPAVVVAIIYKLAHLEDWTRYDLGLLLLFQIVIASSGGCLFFGRVEPAVVILAVFGAFLAILASIVRSL